jgi:HK97 family phage major capsid protein
MEESFMETALETRYEELVRRQQALEAQIHGKREVKELRPRATDEYRKAYLEFLQGGMPQNILKTGTGPSGGYLIPDEMESQLIEVLAEQNIFRRIGHVLKTEHDRKIPVVANHGSAIWVDEEGAFLDSDEDFGQITLGAHKAGTSIRLSDELLQDAGFDIEAYVIRELAARLGRLEEAAFVNGTGTSTPTGIIRTAPVGVVSAQPGKLDVDDLIDLMYSVSKPYRENAVWVFHDSTEREIRKLKNDFGRRLWEPSITEDAPDLFLGKPVIPCSSMSCIASGEKPVLFGDFRFYWIADRGRRSLKRLNELYATSGQVSFLATQRVDAKLILPEAVKCLQIK